MWHLVKLNRERDDKLLNENHENYPTGKNEKTTLNDTAATEEVRPTNEYGQKSSTLIPSDDLIREHYNLISLGVRPMTLIGEIEAHPVKIQNLYNKLSCLAWEEGVGGGAPGVRPIAFVIQEKEGVWARYGYASSGWIPETFKWILDNDDSEHRHRLIGLLLGYSIESITMHDELNRGALYPDTVTELDKLPPDDPLL